MTGITDLIRRMRKLGAPIEAIEVAIEVIESISAQDSARRRKNAARMAGKRAKKEEAVRAQCEQRARTVQHMCAHIEQPIESSAEIQPEPPAAAKNDSLSLSKKDTKQEVREERKKEAPQKRGAKLPPDWIPSEKHFLAGEGLGFSAAEVESMAEDLRLWARANEHRQVARKSDWHSTFSAWMRRSSRGPPGMNGQVVSIKDRKQQEWDDARAKLRRYVSGAEDSGGSGEPAFGFLPQIGSE